MHNNILRITIKSTLFMSHDTVMHLVKHLDKPLTYPARGKLDDKCGKDPNFVIRKISKGLDVACK